MLLENGVKIIFCEPQEAVTPGQSAVIYRDDIVMGGGVIAETIYENEQITKLSKT